MEELAETNQRTDPSPGLGQVQLGDFLAEQSEHDGSQAVSVSHHAAPDCLLLGPTEGEWKQILGFTVELGEQFEHFNPPDLEDLCGKKFNGSGLQGNSVTAAHPSYPVVTGEAATAPAELGSTGTGHQVAAVGLLPGSSTPGADSHLHHRLQLGVLGGLGSEGGEGLEVPAGGGAVLLPATETAVAVAALTVNHRPTSLPPPGNLAAVWPGTEVQPGLPPHQPLQPLPHQAAVEGAPRHPV